MRGFPISVSGSIEKMNDIELNKFLKFLAVKFTQVIVQSRLGSTITTKCNKQGQDWVSDDEFFKFSRKSKVRKFLGKEKQRIEMDLIVADMENVNKSSVKRNKQED